MKRILILITGLTILSYVSSAQNGSKEKNKDKDKANAAADKSKGNSNSNGNGSGSSDEKAKKDKADKQKHETAVWNGTKDSDGGGPKPSKNQPAKVRSAFQRDYPNATNVSWSKYRGDWTATFRNGVFWSTAIYHANGERRDTRTQIPREQLPPKIEDVIKKKGAIERIGDIIRVKIPKTSSDVYRVQTTENGTVKFQFFNTDGVVVKYDY